MKKSSNLKFLSFRPFLCQKSKRYIIMLCIFSKRDFPEKKNTLKKKSLQNQRKIKLSVIQITETSIFAPIV